MPANNVTVTDVKERLTGDHWDQLDFIQGEIAICQFPMDTPRTCMYTRRRGQHTGQLIRCLAVQRAILSVMKNPSQQVDGIFDSNTPIH